MPNEAPNVSRRSFFKTVAGAAGAAALTPGMSAAALTPDAGTAAFSRVLGLDKAAGNKRPNILYIHSHDTGRFTSPYGHAVPTPNLQRLAADGILFAQAFTPAPTCSPSRASLLTGHCPHSNGMLGLAHRGFRLNDYGQHIVHTLRREAGYTSSLIGLQHIATNPAMIGYDHVELIRGNHVDDVAPAAARFIRSQPKQPFWLTVGFQETHREYRKATGDDDPRFMLPPAPLPDVDATRQDMADFHATVRKLDWGVGEVLAALEAAGLAENTIVLSTTDHGIAFPEMKCSLYDAGMGVHLVMRGPGGFFGGKVCDALISQLDIFPTICDVLEIPHPAWLQGKSFLPLIRGQAQEVNDEIFSEVNFHAAYEPKRCVRTKKWKYIKRFGTYKKPVLPNCDDGPSKKYWLDSGWGKRDVPSEELYDLTFDPNERNNLVGDPTRQAVLEDMRGRLAAWMQRTSDPILKGQLKPPPDSQINPVDGISPKEPTVAGSTMG